MFIFLAILLTSQSRKDFTEPRYVQKNSHLVQFHAGGIIESYFFKNEAGTKITVSGKRYRTMINDYFF